MLPPFVVCRKVRSIGGACLFGDSHIIIRGAEAVFHCLDVLLCVVLKNLVGACKFRALEHDWLAGICMELGVFIIILIQLKQEAAGHIDGAVLVFRKLCKIVRNLVSGSQVSDAVAGDPVHMFIQVILKGVPGVPLDAFFFSDGLRHIACQAFPVMDIYAALLYPHISHKLVVSGVNVV